MLREGDTLVVWKLDRLGRSLKHLVSVINDFQEVGVGFMSLTESINTTTPGGKLIFHVFGALAEFERNLIKERAKAGLKAARDRGRKGGRPPALMGKQKQKAVELYHAGIYNARQISDLMSISIPTLYKYVNEAEEKRKEISDK
jgi:DNA invertase Pin-like site-specific DNA recombinase